MKIERTFIKEDMLMHYIITDNKCTCCKHSPKNYCPCSGYDGKCKDANDSVVECVNFEKIKTY